MYSRSFPPERRIRSKQEFTDIIKQGTRRRGTVINIFCRQGAGRVSRLGISIGRKYGNAVKRNRFKRIVREAFRMCMEDLPVMDIVVIPVRTSADLKLEACVRDFHALYQNIVKN